MCFAMIVVLVTAEIYLYVMFLLLHRELNQWQSSYGFTPCAAAWHTENSKLWRWVGVDYHVVTSQEEVT
jgi:hypothetical protein